MPAHRFGEPLTDGDIDRALGAALAVEPSPEFLARVRMRIASEPEPSGWRLPWMLAAGACTIAVAVAITVMQTSHPALAPGLPSTAFGDLSFLPARLPGPLTVAAAGPRRLRREKPTPEMQAIMQSNAAARMALDAHRTDRNYDAIVNDAATFKQNFAYVEAFWANRQMEDPVAITRTGLDAAAALQAAARAKDDAAIENAIAALAGTCLACHKQYREQLPDESFEIRL
jgi:cytochrome c'